MGVCNRARGVAQVRPFPTGSRRRQPPTHSHATRPHQGVGSAKAGKGGQDARSTRATPGVSAQTCPSASRAGRDQGTAPSPPRLTRGTPSRRTACRRACYPQGTRGVHEQCVATGCGQRGPVSGECVVKPTPSPDTRPLSRSRCIHPTCAIDTRSDGGMPSCTDRGADLWWNALAGSSAHACCGSRAHKSVASMASRASGRHRRFWGVRAPEILAGVSRRPRGATWSPATADAPAGRPQSPASVAVRSS